ncbi:hypothetical protein ILYODFUR_031576 [Ilyodon furcidens]|uniref:Secreted protein n=1 Tax=Ilyodon furcidens TaxID=33524 RepID=A0ABV0UWZ7_9TELE
MVLILPPPPLLLLLLLLGYPNSPWQDHTQDSPVGVVALAPCIGKKKRARMNVAMPPSDFSSSSSSSSAPFSPLRSRMQVWSLCRKRGEKKNLYYTIRRGRRVGPQTALVLSRCERERRCASVQTLTSASLCLCTDAE